MIPKKNVYIPPSAQGYSIYSISGCKYCTKAKELLKEQKKTCTNINCDKYMTSLRERDAFYAYIRPYTVKQYLYFPMIFKNGKFIGGYKEIMEHFGKTV